MGFEKLLIPGILLSDGWDIIIKPHECGFWGSRNTLMMVFGPGNHRDRKSHECGFIFIQCHKNYRKTTPSSPWRRDEAKNNAKFAMTSRWSYDITSTCPTIRMTSLRIPTTLTQQRKSVLHACCIWYFYTTPGYHGSIAALPTGQIFYEIYRVGDSARCRINFARKGILVCVF
jgi:hypothetical protein